MNTGTPIKLTNPLSDRPTEMWLQAITDFEVTLDDPRYKINMSCWYHRSLDEPCLVCMAGASMAQRTGGLHPHVELEDFDDRTALKFESINDMRRGHFWNALILLPLEGQDYKRWCEALKASRAVTLLAAIRDANNTRDWRGLIELLREAIARIDAEYERLSKQPTLRKESAQ